MLREELLGLQITVPTDSIGFVKFWREAIKKNKSVVEEVETLHDTVNG